MGAGSRSAHGRDGDGGGGGGGGRAWEQEKNLGICSADMQI